MHKQVKNEIGNVYGRLVVIKAAESKNGKARWVCKCSCGKELVVGGDSLRNKGTKSCGCLNKDTCGDIFRTHGLSKTRLYTIYNDMKQRCYNKNSSEYNIYGGKGIKICDDWLLSFKNFYDWAILNGYDKTFSLDRIDGNKNYTPENCRWATRKTQAVNRKTTIFIEDDGVKICLKDFCKKRNLKYKLVQSRLKKGQSLDVVIQLAGLDLPYDIAELHTQRQAIRDEINRLEQ